LTLQFSQTVDASAEDWFAQTALFYQIEWFEPPIVIGF
jgi:hypothetical protein